MNPVRKCSTLGITPCVKCQYLGQKSVIITPKGVMLGICNRLLQVLHNTGLISYSNLHHRPLARRTADVDEPSPTLHKAVFIEAFTVHDFGWWSHVMSYQVPRYTWPGSTAVAIVDRRGLMVSKSSVFQTNWQQRWQRLAYCDTTNISNSEEIGSQKWKVHRDCTFHILPVVQNGHTKRVGLTMIVFLALLHENDCSLRNVA